MQRGRRWISGLALLVLGALALGLTGGPGAAGKVPPCDGYGHGYGYGYGYGYGSGSGYGYGYNTPCPTPTPTKTPTPSPTPTRTPLPTVSPTPTPTPTPTLTPTPTATPPPGDHKPCRVRVRAERRQTIRSVRRFGLRLRFTTNERCRLDIRVYIDKRTARRLRIDRHARGPVLVARRTVTLPPGTRTVTLRLTRRARRGFRHARKVHLTVRVTTRDAAGNRGTLRPYRITLRR
jgi:hypothetical protein